MSNQISPAPAHTLNPKDIAFEGSEEVTTLLIDSNKANPRTFPLTKPDQNCFTDLLTPDNGKTIINSDSKAILTNVNVDSVESGLAPKPRRQTIVCTIPILDKILQICGKKVHITSVYSAGITIASISLLVLYIVKTRAVDSSNEGMNPTLLSIAKGSSLQQVAFNFEGLSGLGRRLVSQKDWNYIENLGSQETILHITVGKNTTAHNQHLTATIDDRALKISGMPKFCKSAVHNTPEELQFKNITHLHLSGMQTCSHYVNLILTKWHFPKVLQIKLHKMFIWEQEFNGLRKFIDRHNETLHKVEIDESFICSSPACDAGMIDFPNHDFQLIITRRRESPKSV